VPATSGCIAVIRLSESFERTILDLAEERGLGCISIEPTASQPPDDCVAILILAGGAEADAVELSGKSGAGGLRRYVVGAAEDHRLAARAVASGAADYFALPGDLDLLRRTIEREAGAWKAGREAERFAAEERSQNGFAAILGESPALRQVIEQARRVAAHREVTVLVEGETGTGKELIARAIHYHSPRSAAPFVEINCTAIPATLIESELFGHEKGAFTGAVASRPGLFELAHGGTIFLDEVGHLPLEAQPKLLRVLEARQVRRVGGQATRGVDVRVIAATHVDLRSAVAAGEFREDLYYRLHVVALTLPPLRERGDDVGHLAEAFATRLAGAYGLPAPVLSPEARAALRTHSWPGNVRELRNAVERALVLSAPGTLAFGDLAADSIPGAADNGRLPLFAPLAAVIRAAVDAMLAETRGNKSEAARRLGISRPRLQRILDGAPE
jgi:DNA-binding NtrC family response regulator